jgi:predicted AAA+ superfamily ATPase
MSLFLQSYCDTYIREEIMEEQVIRNLPPFKRFLEVAAQNHSEIINYSNISRDNQSDPKTVQGYYQILEVTLLGFFLPPYHLSIRKRQRQSPKFYWFDCGIVRALTYSLDSNLVSTAPEFGRLFESFLINEIYRQVSYSKKQIQLSYLRTKDDIEIDLIIEQKGHPLLLIEIKSTQNLTESHLSRFIKISKDINNSKALCFSNDPNAKKIDNVDCFHWKDGVDMLAKNFYE